MSETGFTPGPWEACPPLDGRWQWGITAGAKYNPTIGALRRIGWVGNYAAQRMLVDVKYNAHLIAAAPDMHGELTEASVTLGELLNENILPFGWAESISALVVGIEDTLSKARGETT